MSISHLIGSAAKTFSTFFKEWPGGFFSRCGAATSPGFAQVSRAGAQARRSGQRCACCGQRCACSGAAICGWRTRARVIWPTGDGAKTEISFDARHTRRRAAGDGQKATGGRPASRCWHPGTQSGRLVFKNLMNAMKQGVIQTGIKTFIGNLGQNLTGQNLRIFLIARTAGSGASGRVLGRLTPRQQCGRHRQRLASPTAACSRGWRGSGAMWPPPKTPCQARSSKPWPRAWVPRWRMPWPAHKPVIWPAPPPCWRPCSTRAWPAINRTGWRSRMWRACSSAAPMPTTP